jgi:FAD/FMN-containing dehydrogenase/Fe-S oxidoreductase
MNPERSRIEADLRGLIEGEVFCDDLYSQMYSTDASILQVRPLGVVRPRHTQDVAAVVRYASENHLPLHARGNGSNVVGAAIGAGLVIDFSVHMRRTVTVDERCVRVQPGVVLANLNRQLAERNMMFGPDPVKRSVTTMGGVISMDSTGSHWKRYGSPREKIRKLKIVLADGHVAEVGCDAAGDAVTKRLGDRIELILGRRQELIADHQPLTCTNHAGYHLTKLARDGRLDLSQLIAGSEGTLALITEATLELQPVPRHRGVVLLFFDQLQAAAHAALEIIRQDVAACDLLDRRLLSIARSTDVRLERIVPVQAEAMVLTELQAADAAALRKQVQYLADRMTGRKGMAFASRTTCSLQERNLYWRLARRGIPMQFGMKGGRQPIPFVEDIAVDPQQIPAFLRDIQKILHSCEVTASLFAHVAQGIIHLRPQLNLDDPRDVACMRELTEKLFSRVFELRGSISGCHGDGILRTGYLRRQYGRMYDVFGEIKREFDPRNVLNPGKIVDSPPYDVYSLLRDHRVVDSAAAGPANHNGSAELAGTSGPPNGRRKKRRGQAVLPVIEPQLKWQLNELATTAADCNGCARCKTASPEERMCPIYRLYPREEASPRSKANLMRDLLNGRIDQQHLNSAELKAIANLCVNCHQCRLECPANADIPRLMIEAKAQHVAVNGLRMSEWILTRLDVLYAIAGRMPRLTNWMIGSRTIRWLLDRMFGIAQARKLPRFANRSFLKVAARRNLTKPARNRDRKVLYFVDAFANWNDVELAEATCAVLKHNGFEIFVPPTQQIAGMSMISAGLIDKARKIAGKNVEVLAEGIRQGCQIVTSEPSAALALQHEYLHFMDEDDAEMVARHCTDISNFLWQLHEKGDLELDFSPLNYTVGYHLPCHQKALGPTLAGMKLLDLIPGLQVERIEKGCSGMAGMYGLIRPNYRRSLRVGLGLINAVRQPHLMAGVTECSTCRIQMEQGTAKPTLHPVKILALAYGLMPELENLFDRRSRRLVIS